MAYQTQDIGQYLKRRASGQGVVTAADVAVVYDTETGAMSESLKDRLDALSTLDIDSLKEEVSKLQTKITNDSRLDSDLVAYTTKDEQETTVKECLDDLLLSVSNSSLLPFAKEGSPSTGTLGEYLLKFENISASDITYLNADTQTTLQDALDNVGDISTAKTEAVTAATNAKTYESGALKWYNDAYILKNEAKEIILEEQNNVLESLKASSNKIDTLTTLAEKMQAAFDVKTSEASETSTKFAILTEETYLGYVKDDSLNDNVVYFCYSADADSATYSTITVKRSNDSMGYVTGEGVYKNRDNASLLAAPKSSDYNFVGWSISPSDTVVSTSPLYTPEVLEDTTYIAQFTESKAMYTIIVAVEKDSKGTVVITADGYDNQTQSGTYPANTTVTITATPPENYQFKEWLFTNSEGSVGIDTNATRSIMVSRNASYVACFAELPKYTVTTSVSDESMGTVSESVTVYSGKSTTIKATAKDGYVFSNWIINGLSVADSPAEYILADIKQDITAVANFAATTVENNDTTES